MKQVVLKNYTIECRDMWILWALLAFSEHPDSDCTMNNILHCTFLQMKHCWLRPSWKKSRLQFLRNIMLKSKFFENQKQFWLFFALSGYPWREQNRFFFYSKVFLQQRAVDWTRDAKLKLVVSDIYESENWDL